MMTIQRIPTGIPGLDDLLCGGLLDGDAVLIAGAPGTGKSTLGMQFLFEGITRFDEAGLYITFEEFPQQIYRDAMNFGWDFRKLEEEEKLKVLFTSPDLMCQDIKRSDGFIMAMIREIGARRVVVDSITHFARMAENAGELREIIYTLINALKREGLTAVLLRELIEGEEQGNVAEEYTTDAVIHLTMDRINEQRMRFVEVLKSRGSRHIPAKSLFYLNDRGLTVVPPFQDAFFRYQEVASIGIPDVDAIMGGGIPYGACYLFEISPEIHQEIFELNFIRETVRSGDLFLEITTSSMRAEKLLHLAQSYGMRDELEQAMVSGDIQIINALELDEEAEKDYALPNLPEEAEEYLDRGETALMDAVARLEEAFQVTSATRRGRLFIDVTGLLAGLDESMFFAVLSPVLDLLQQYGGICLGFLNPGAVPDSARQKLLTEVDGIVRVWREGYYNYIQVKKTVNSVMTLVNVLTETNTPPYVKLLPY